MSTRSEPIQRNSIDSGSRPAVTEQSSTKNIGTVYEAETQNPPLSPWHQGTDHGEKWQASPGEDGPSTKNKDTWMISETTSETTSDHEFFSDSIKESTHDSGQNSASFLSCSTTRSLHSEMADRDIPRRVSSAETTSRQVHYGDDSAATAHGGRSTSTSLE